MSILEHLKDLRKHVLWSLLGIIVGAVGGWFLYDPVMEYITAPLLAMQNADTQINFPTIGAALDLKLRVSLWIGLIISCPWWIYQIGAFIIPGLKCKERWYAFAFGAVGVMLFVSGAATGVALVPRAVEILQSFVPVGGSSLLQADAYVDFYIRLVILFGVSFLIPEVLVVLNFLGVLSARNMLRAWRWAVLVAFIFAAIANPLPSPWPMIVQALILVALYLVAVLISWINERYRAYGWRLRERKKNDGAVGSASSRPQGPGGYPVPVDAGGPAPVGVYGPALAGTYGPAPMGQGGYPVPVGQGGQNSAPVAYPGSVPGAYPRPAEGFGQNFGQNPVPVFPQVPPPVMPPVSGPVTEPLVTNSGGPVQGVGGPVHQPVTRMVPQPMYNPMPPASQTSHISQASGPQPDVDEASQAQPAAPAVAANPLGPVDLGSVKLESVGPESVEQMKQMTQPQPAAPAATQLCGVVILAGGTAKRMGGVSKPDVVVGGKTLLVRAIEEVRAVAPEAAIVVVAPPQVAVPQGVARVLEDPPFGGPVAGVAAGCERLATLPGYRLGGLVGLLTCDAPLAPRLYPELEQAYREATVQSLREANATNEGKPAQFVGGAVPLVSEESVAGVTEGRNASYAVLKHPDGFVASAPLASGVSSTSGVGTASAGEVAGTGEVMKLSVEKPATYSQYLHGVYVAGALTQLFAAQVRNRSVRSLFKQLRLATVADIARVGMDVDTWEDAAELERRLAEFG